MGEFTKWLLHEDQKELFDYLFRERAEHRFSRGCSGRLVRRQWPGG
jgi:hypothetical protein